MGARQSQHTSSTNSRIKPINSDGGVTRPASAAEGEGSSTDVSVSDGHRNRKQSKAAGEAQEKKNMGTLVVVNNPGPNSLESSTSSQPHPVLQRLNEIPYFNPVLQQREIKMSGWMNEKSIVTTNQLVPHALEISPYLNIGHLFQTLVHENAHAISVRQAKLTKCIKDYDKKLAQLMKLYIQRQKNFAKHAEKLAKVGECTRSLARCQNTIQSCKNTIQELNQLLPTDERLEPFVWGDDDIELAKMN
jgi:hypothetical protein